MADTATYVYCAVHRDGPPRLGSRMPAVPGGSRPVAERASNRLWLVSSDVPLSRYSPEALEPRLRDVDWIGQVALAHETVVARAAALQGATAIPMKLFTMFSDREKALDEIRQRQAELLALVRRIRGCAEWGVRIVRANGRPIPREGPRAASGTAFLTARKAARDRARDAALRSADAAADAYDLLARSAREATRRDIPDAAVAPPLLDAAFLVPRAKTAAFKTQVRRAGTRCADAGATLLLTGPWPAYSFLEPSP